MDKKAKAFIDGQWREIQERRLVRDGILDSILALSWAWKKPLFYLAIWAASIAAWEVVR